VITLLQNDVSQREISRKTGVDRKTIRKIAQEMAADPPKSPTPATGLRSKSPTPTTGERAGQGVHTDAFCL
jgi:hypothetical protein